MMKEPFVTINEKDEQVVVIPQILFEGKRSISWPDVEKYIGRFVGDVVEIEATNELIYIDTGFMDEFTGSVYTRNLKGGVAKAKANLSQGIPQLIRIGKNRRWSEDFGQRHGKRAQKGWYRYDTKFALPVMDSSGMIDRYNVYRAVLVVRYAADGRKYLYDIQSIKKETSNPPWT